MTEALITENCRHNLPSQNDSYTNKWAYPQFAKYHRKKVRRLLCTFHNFQKVQQTERVFPMALAPATVDALDSLPVKYLWLGWLHGPTLKARHCDRDVLYLCHDTQMPCGDHEIQSMSRDTSPLSSNWCFTALKPAFCSFRAYEKHTSLFALALLSTNSCWYFHKSPPW